MSHGLVTEYRKEGFVSIRRSFHKLTSRNEEIKSTAYDDR